jgi:hypothetical protein
MVPFLDLSVRVPGDRDKVDAVARTFFIRKIVAKMSPRQTHRLTIGKATYIFPYHLLIAKGRPTVGTTFHQKVLQGSSTRRHEERLSRVGIVKGNFFTSILGLLDKLCGFKVATVFGVVTVKVANAIGRRGVAFPPEIVLNGSVERTIVCFMITSREGVIVTLRKILTCQRFRAPSWT